ncbi:hypothetical protein MPLDJ20_80250 [Mesorhizobium plurifarium]|uniref:Uncharacterized protein n=1 Tax=Mesorhizobium plurifarium TaxID=69974 RepID=A0A090FQC4_MESPL|nr:hypothetical protein MPLDJ20_80250 [Mesorhizobium plurifarium]
MNSARVSIINKSDLIIDSRSGLVFFEVCPRWEKKVDAHETPGGRRPQQFHWEENRDQEITAEVYRVCGRGPGADGVRVVGIGRRRRRLPDHQDRHQSLLRQDEGGRDSQGQGAWRRSQDLCR